jgi:hypothetical protein
MALTISSTFQDDILRIYTTHLDLASDPEIPPRYHMNRLGAWALNGSRDQFQEGVSAFRNARDWAKDQRDALIAAANRRFEEGE